MPSLLAICQAVESPEKIRFWDNQTLRNIGEIITGQVSSIRWLRHQPTAAAKAMGSRNRMDSYRQAVRAKPV